MTTPVNFSIAKLLKEKGFDSYRTSQYVQLSNDNWKLLTNQEYQDLDCEIGIGGNIRISAPTIADVVMWLYEKHEIWIDVSLNQFSKPKDLQWMYSIVFTEDCTYSHSPKSYISPTEAYEAAIEYVLTKLIKDVQTNQ